MKKRLLLAAVAAVCFTACQNDYTCVCKYTDEFDGQIDRFEEEFKIKEATRTQARAACIEARIVQDDEWGRFERICELD